MVKRFDSKNPKLPIYGPAVVKFSGRTFNIHADGVAVAKDHPLAGRTHDWHRNNWFALVEKKRLSAYETAKAAVKAEELARGRFKFAKTCVRSAEAKTRRNAKYKRKQYAKRGRPGYYHYKGTDCLFNVLDIAYVPKERYTYHQKRYERAGKPFVLRQSWGFKLPSDRKCDLPHTVFAALVGIYSRPVLEVPPERPARRTQVRNPRNRTRSDSLSRALRAVEELCSEDVANIVKRPGLLARATGELSLRMRNDPHYQPDEAMYWLLTDANEYMRTKEFHKSLKREGNETFRASEIIDEMNGIISLNKAREELKKRLRRNARVVHGPSGSSGFNFTAK